MHLVCGSTWYTIQNYFTSKSLPIYSIAKPKVKGPSSSPWIQEGFCAKIFKDIFGKAGSSIQSLGSLGVVYSHWSSHLCFASFFSSLQIFLSGSEALKRLNCWVFFSFFEIKVFLFSWVIISLALAASHCAWCCVSAFNFLPFDSSLSCSFTVSKSPKSYNLNSGHTQRNTMPDLILNTQSQKLLPLKTKPSVWPDSKGMKLSLKHWFFFLATSEDFKNWYYGWLIVIV